MTRPIVSVVTVVRDPHPEQFAAAVASVLGQTLDGFEFLVIEDAGERPDAAPVRPVAPVLARFSDPRLRHVVHDGVGIASARNRGLQEARAELVAMADADDVNHPERLATQVAHLREAPDLVVLGTSLRIVDEEDRVVGTRDYPTTHEAIRRTLPRYNPIAQPSVMLRKAVVDDHGGYRDHTCEDYELWSRLARNGARFGNVAARLVDYRVHQTSMKARKLRASLRDTLAIKQMHWGDELGLRGRLRMLGERALLGLPAPWVMRLFRLLCYRKPRP